MLRQLRVQDGKDREDLVGESFYQLPLSELGLLDALLPESVRLSPPLPPSSSSYGRLPDRSNKLGRPPVAPASAQSGGGGLPLILRMDILLVGALSLL
jgi:hypothetical protein